MAGAGKGWTDVCLHKPGVCHRPGVPLSGLCRRVRVPNQWQEQKQRQFVTNILPTGMEHVHPEHSLRVVRSCARGVGDVLGYAANEGTQNI